MSRPPSAIYAEVVDRTSGAAPAASTRRGHALTVLRRAWHGLGPVLAGREPPSAWQWRSAAERRTAYAALAVATLVVCLISVGTVHGAIGLHGPAGQRTLVSQLPPVLVQRLLAIVVVAPLPLAARRPMLAWRIGWLALLLVPLLPATWWGGWPWGPPQLAALLAAFCLAGVRQPRAALAWMWALTLVPWLLWLTSRIQDLNGPASASVVFTAAAIVVDSLRARLLAQRDLVTQTQRAEAEQARRAVLEERTRIARELHDVVAHHLSLIAVRAETAPYRLPGLAGPVAGEFGSLSGLAREALTDMRRLLGVMRQDQPAALAPQPQLTDLPELVAVTRRAGVPVELTFPAELGQVPAGVGVCAYRIVQESLSNASQHAPGAAVTVSVGQEQGAVRLRVTNGPGTPAGQDRAELRPGHGLTGMRERVALLGGSLSAGPAPGGGFEVCAVLPVGEAP